MLVLLVGLVATGAALAAPGGLGNNQQTRVVGTIELVSGVDGTILSQDPTTNELVKAGSVYTYKFHGNLEGTFVEGVTARAPVSPPALSGKGPYTLEGWALFDGTLNGKKLSWAADLAGAGYLDPAYAFRGWETCVSTIASSVCPLPRLRGTIVSTGMFDATDPTYGSKTYSGWLTWETGKK